MEKLKKIGKTKAVGNETVKNTKAVDLKESIINSGFNPSKIQNQDSTDW